MDAATHARLLLRALRRRSEYFPELNAGSPEWAMVLDLLVQQHRGRRVSVQSACLASGAPVTTALRHLGKLVEAGEIVKTADEKDGRRIFVTLAPEFERRLRQYLERFAPAEVIRSETR
jgi:DNA-binding MarR family transcriptional regulator